MIFRELWQDARELAQIAHGGTDLKALLRTVLGTDSFQVTALHRLGKVARAWRIVGVGHLLRLVQTVIHGIEIGKDVRLGNGVYFIHPLGTVVGGDAQVGNRVRFFGNNTVGTAKENGYPVIEDDVWVGAGARILGPIRVGARSTIGANAVVIADVPPDSVAVGVPASIRIPKPGA